MHRHAGVGPVVRSSPGRVASSDGPQRRPRCCNAVAAGRVYARVVPSAYRGCPVEHLEPV